MITIKTVNNDVFEIAWAGVATIDGVLRFAILNANLIDVMTAFTNPVNCTILTRIFDENEKEFTGFTVFRGIQIAYDNSVIVSMSKN